MGAVGSVRQYGCRRVRSVAGRRDERSRAALPSGPGTRSLPRPAAFRSRVPAGGRIAAPGFGCNPRVNSERALGHRGGEDSPGADGVGHAAPGGRRGGGPAEVRAGGASGAGPHTPRHDRHPGRGHGSEDPRCALGRRRKRASLRDQTGPRAPRARRGDERQERRIEGRDYRQHGVPTGHAPQQTSMAPAAAEEDVSTEKPKELSISRRMGIGPSESGTGRCVPPSARGTCVKSPPDFGETGTPKPGYEIGTRVLLVNGPSTEGSVFTFSFRIGATGRHSSSSAASAYFWARFTTSSSKSRSRHCSSRSATSASYPCPVGS